MKFLFYFFIRKANIKSFISFSSKNSTLVTAAYRLKYFMHSRIWSASPGVLCDSSIKYFNPCSIPFIIFLFPQKGVSSMSAHICCPINKISVK